MQRVGQEKKKQPPPRDFDVPKRFLDPATKVSLRDIQDKQRKLKPQQLQGDPQTWILAGGLGWIYGLGLMVGPFFGGGVGLTFPAGIVCGSGGGVGIVCGIGFGSGLVWGTGRGSITGLGVPLPMRPPTLPTLSELCESTLHFGSQARLLALEGAAQLRAARATTRAAQRDGTRANEGSAFLGPSWLLGWEEEALRPRAQLLHPSKHAFHRNRLPRLDRNVPTKAMRTTHIPTTFALAQTRAADLRGCRQASCGAIPAQNFNLEAMQDKPNMLASREALTAKSE